MNPESTEKQNADSGLRPMEPVVEGDELEARPNGPKWVIIVDDDVDVLRSVADFVEDLPFSPRLRVRTARSGPEAIEYMARHFFDLIITDFSLGAMDGVRFLEVARNMEPDVPCVMMTGDPTEALERLGTLPGENVALLEKPLDPAALRSYCMNALELGRPVVGRQIAKLRAANLRSSSLSTTPNRDPAHGRRPSRPPSMKRDT